MRKSLVTFLVFTAVVGASACKPVPMVRACATVSTPPIVVEEQQCLDNVTGVQWYSAPESDISPDDAPVVGEKLDGDFWDLKDQLDLDEKKSSTTKAPKTKAAKATKTTKS
jgi:hypothetical protein